MFIEPGRWPCRTPAGCHVCHLLHLYEGSSGTLHPAGVRSRTDHVSINIAPLQCVNPLFQKGAFLHGSSLEWPQIEAGS